MFSGRVGFYPNGVYDGSPPPITVDRVGAARSALRLPDPVFTEPRARRQLDERAVDQSTRFLGR